MKKSTLANEIKANFKILVFSLIAALLIPTGYYHYIIQKDKEMVEKWNSEIRNLKFSWVSIEGYINNYPDRSARIKRLHAESVLLGCRLPISTASFKDLSKCHNDRIERMGELAYGLWVLLSLTIAPSIILIRLVFLLLRWVNKHST